MRRAILIMTSLTIVGLLGACNNDVSKHHDFHMEDVPTTNTEKSMHGRGPMHGPMMGHGHHNEMIILPNSTGENELNVPPILQSDEETNDEVYYTIEAQKGKTEIFNGIETETWGRAATTFTRIQRHSLITTGR